jgi:hypothetical protein
MNLDTKDAGSFGWNTLESLMLSGSIARQMRFPLLLLLLLLLLYSPLLGRARFFSFLILYTVGWTPLTGISPSQGLYLHTEH